MIRFGWPPKWHRIARWEDDPRIGWTLCGQRFAYFGERATYDERHKCRRCKP